MKYLNLLIVVLLFTFTSCDNSSDNSGFNSKINNVNNTNNTNVNNVNNVNNTNNINNIQMAYIRGRVWGPGSDDINVTLNNRFPVPGALVAVYTSGIEDPHDGNYCNKCVELPEGIPNIITDVDGYFELPVIPNNNYKLLVQKGEFRRVSYITTPGPGEYLDLDDTGDQPTNPQVTLPNKHNPTNGQWIPKIAVIKGSYENMENMFKALGFSYDGERIVEISPSGDLQHPFDPTPADELLSNPSEMAKYNIIAITCGGSIAALDSSDERQNLMDWVNGGGKLYVDDFSYDWAEQAWPEFLSFWVENPEDGGDFTSPTACGEGSSPDSIDSCNNWSSYSTAGYPEDQDLASWLALANVNRGQSLQLEAAWNIIHEIGPGPWGECQEVEPDCRNNVAYYPPKVWMRGDAPGGHSNNPMTVSWNYYCGKVLYTVYHTHSDGFGGDPSTYNLLIQEKIMMYLLMEISTCTKPNIVE